MMVKPCAGPPMLIVSSRASTMLLLVQVALAVKDET
jgi:hypothetical protein